MVLRHLVGLDDARQVQPLVRLEQERDVALQSVQLRAIEVPRDLGRRVEVLVERNAHGACILGRL